MTATEAKTPAAIAPNTKGETPEMLKAFDCYLKLGSRRSLKKAAEKLGMELQALERWSKTHNWHSRILAIQKEAVDAAKEETKEQFFKDVKNLTEYKYELLDILKSKVNTHRFCGACEQSPASITEIIRVLEVVKVELNEPTSIAKGQWTGEKPNPFAGIFEQLFGKKDNENDRAI